MPGSSPFTLDHLRATLRAAAGADDISSLEGAIDDTEFVSLGYDSIALLETTSRIEREWSVSLDEQAMAAASTPRELVALVNAHLSAKTP
ncbi:actinorhodin polyketide synthase [Amycolatopsis orientalis]|uniref:Actinorhodin polyketide synthase n=1 Tax=Amycolatopsis orientalis TaxID=31958 RepID=A0A193BUH0_AMYOR|nr:acyl carrier protein [Amycolatopsis orientalis]ANN15830.1 actinorhodin polyketide synthase [Amycolatopsis orientalis]